MISHTRNNSNDAHRLCLFTRQIVGPISQRGFWLITLYPALSDLVVARSTLIFSSWMSASLTFFANDAKINNSYRRTYSRVNFRISQSFYSIGLFSGTISISSQMTQCRITLLLQSITKLYLFTIELKLRDDLNKNSIFSTTNYFDSSFRPFSCIVE